MIIKSNCSIVQDVTIGENSIIHNGTVLGSDGFGYAPTKTGYIKIEQIGKLIIKKNVEIGANCAIDRGALGNTIIKDGVKFDNHIHIAHNVEIGENTAIAGQSGVAGSVKIGKNCQKSRSYITSSKCVKKPLLRPWLARGARLSKTQNELLIHELHFFSILICPYETDKDCYLFDTSCHSPWSGKTNLLSVYDV